jgi:hypothetical protein
MIIIIVAILGTLVLGAIIGVIVYFKCRKDPDMESKTIKKFPAMGDGSVIDHDATDNLEAQYHPKAEIGNIFLNGQIQKENDADIVDSSGKDFQTN